MLELATIVLTLGAIVHHSVGMSLYTIMLLAVSGALLCSFYFRTKQGIIFSLLIGLIFLWGALAVETIEINKSNDLYGNRSFSGKVVSADRRLSQTILIVQEQHIRYHITLPKSDLLPGDLVFLRGKVEAPEAFLTDNGRLFDYPAYLESKGISAVMENPMVELREQGHWSINRLATKLRFSIAEIFSRTVRFPIDGIVSGMLVGYQGGLPKTIQDLFRNTGVLHVLVLSGYNIMLLAGFLMVLLKTFPFKTRTGITIVAIILLVLISGSGIASVRAGIMGSIALFAGLVQRTYQPLRALTLAYLFFFFLSPLTVFADPGFHLSFLATIFMILVLPKIESLFHFLPASKGVNIRELIMLAVSVPFFMLPYTMYFSGTVPLSSPFANILLALLTPIMMLVGTSILAVSFVTPIAAILATILSYIGTITVSILSFFSSFPQWNTPPLSWWGVDLFYIAFIGIVFRKEITLYVKHLQNLLLPASSSADS